ncbi:MAG: hypothetical protein AAF581_09440 [Planctomycetota bacterium]
MKRFDKWTLVGLLLVCGAVFLTACNSGGRAGGGSGILNLVSAAPPLDNDNANYATAKLNTPGYGHTATYLGDGTVVIIAGTDERHFTTLDRAEIYDQTVREDPAPESISGVWIDLDFAGDPILLQFGGRCFHTATELADGNVLVAGGTTDILVGEAVADAEIYDRQSRAFNPTFLQINNTMINPRFNHTATQTGTGKVLLAGGQRAVMETIIDPNFPPGNPLFMVDILTFPSTETMEFFNPATMEFEEALNQAGQEIELQTSRGRSEHTVIAVGGFDNSLNTTDDKFIIAGGIRTLSPLFAPQVKFPQRAQVFQMQSVEFYDRTAGLVNVANNLQTEVHANGSRSLNYGAFSKVTPTGAEGTTNIALICFGNNDSNNQIGSPGWSQPQAEEIVVTFTGFGPSEGIEFWSATNELAGVLQLNGNWEYVVALALAGGMCIDGTFGGFIGRVECPITNVSYNRMINGEAFQGGWAVTAGGGNTHQANLGTPRVGHETWCIVDDVLSFEYFDPFYDAPPAYGLLLDPTTTADQPNDNPTALIGAWLAADFVVAEETAGVGLLDSTAVPNMSKLRSPACYHTMTTIPGEDGVINTFDDRVLVAGGGENWLQTGGEPSSVSGQVFLPAGAND